MENLKTVPNIFFADLQAEDNSESEVRVLVENKTRKIYFQGQKMTV